MPAAALNGFTRSKSTWKALPPPQHQGRPESTTVRFWAEPLARRTPKPELSAEEREFLRDTIVALEEILRGHGLALAAVSARLPGASEDGECNMEIERQVTQNGAELLIVLANAVTDALDRHPTEPKAILNHAILNRAVDILAHFRRAHRLAGRDTFTELQEKADALRARSLVDPIES